MFFKVYFLGRKEVMKFFVFLFAIFVKFNIFASYLSVNDKLNMAVSFFNNILSETDSAYSQAVSCSEFRCDTKVFYNNSEIGRVYFVYEENVVHNASKVTVNILNNDNINDLIIMKYICLYNDICRVFNFEQFYLADYAYQNNQFYYQRQKRSPHLSSRFSYFYIFNEYKKNLEKSNNDKNKDTSVRNNFFRLFLPF